MQRIYALACITFLDGLRQHTLWGLILFALAMESCGIFFMDFFGHNLGRASSDFLNSITWLAGMVFLLFYCVQAIAWDRDDKMIYAILSRPLSRAEYVLGSMCGLSLLLLSLQSVLAIVSFIILLIAQQLVTPIYFPTFSPSHFLINWLGLQATLLAYLAIIMLVSSAIRGSFPTLLITLAYILISSGLPIVRESIHQQVIKGHMSEWVDSLLQMMSLLFPNYSLLDFKDSIVSLVPVHQGLGMSPIILFAQTTLYTIIILSCACMIYQRRDLL